MENIEKKINWHLIRGWVIIVAILLVAYFGEFLKGQRTGKYMIFFSVFTVAPALICSLFYRRNREDKRLRYLILGGYFVMYTFVLLTGSTMMVFTYILPMLSLIVLYHQPALVLAMGVMAVIANLVYDLKLYLAGGITVDNSKDVEIQLALLVLCFGFLYVASRLYDRIDRKNREYLEALDAKQRQLQRVTLQTITTVANTIDAKDEYTKGHSQRVSEYSALIARMLGRDEAYVQNIKYIGLLHDIGKIGVPDAILNKPGRLTDSEFMLMKQHAEIGSNILKDNGMIDGLADGVRHHHERYDGKGYPDGLKGEEISEVARIIGLADAYDAMTSNRVYRKRLADEDIIKEIERCSGTQFDPKLAEIFVRALKEKKIQQLSPDVYVQADNLEEQSTRLLQSILEFQNAQNSLKEERDYLTGAYNRRNGERKITEYLQGGGGGSLMLVDIMNLREINSKYSFIGGDNLIRMVAEALKEYGRSGDIISRFDGDEFLYFAKDVTDQQHVEELMEDILSSVKKHIREKKEYEKVRLCAGGVASTAVQKDYESMLIAADKALYYMKQLKKEGYYLYRVADRKAYEEGLLSGTDLKQMLQSICRGGRYESTYRIDSGELEKLYEFAKKAVDESRGDVRLFLMTLTPTQDRKYTVLEWDEGMVHLEGAVNTVLQAEDFMMRVSGTQCLALLTGLAPDKAQETASRIVSHFYKSRGREGFMVRCETAEL